MAKVLLVERTNKTSGEYKIFSSLILTIDGTDCEGVVCPQDQSRAAVVLTGAHLVTGTGGGVRVH